MEVLELAGIGEIKVRRSANIKYLRIRMAPGRGVWVSVPFGVSRKQVEKFLEENREWILKNRKDMKNYFSLETMPKNSDFVTDGLRSGTIFPIGVVVLLTIISVSISS